MRISPKLSTIVILILLVASMSLRSNIITSNSTDYTITVNGTPFATTNISASVNEVCGRFNINNIMDLGLKNYQAMTEPTKLADTDGAFGIQEISNKKSSSNISYRNCVSAYSVTDTIPSMVDIQPFAAKDPATGTIYVEIVNNTAETRTVTLDLTSLATTGTVTFHEYNTSKKAVVIGTGTLVNGTINFTLPANSITQLIK